MQYVLKLPQIYTHNMYVFMHLVFIIFFIISMQDIWLVISLSISVRYFIIKTYNNSVCMHVDNSILYRGYILWV